mmetsp:Transcript_51204/g.153817  ORF Transcript_51204/g.153817 Transcript_51204/m.153817 type:complete len:100 (-) Transcript_51204:131-430(-)
MHNAQVPAFIASDVLVELLDSFDNRLAAALSKLSFEIAFRDKATKPTLREGLRSENEVKTFVVAARRQRQQERNRSKRSLIGTLLGWCHVFVLPLTRKI